MKSKIDNIFYWIEANRSKTKLLLLSIVLFILIGAYIIVYLTGGSKYVFTHAMYIPIILAALIFGVKAGMPVALAGGILLGPFMPLDTSTGEMQSMSNWLYRVGFFLLIGFFTGIMSDIAMAYLNRINWDATHDKLTGLQNKHALSKAIKGIVESDAKNHYLFVVWMKNRIQIEANFGIDSINEIIIQMAKVLNNTLTAQLTVYRIGTEYLGFIKIADDISHIEKLAKTIGEIFTGSFAYGNIRLHADIFLGVVPLHVKEINPDIYIQKASSTAIEGSGRSHKYAISEAVYTSNDIRDRLELLGELEEALTNEQLFLLYQPKVTLATGMIESSEALMRWKHPVRGNIPPSMFIPYAEDSTLIDKITRFALQKSMSQLVQWSNEDINKIKVAVNISTRNLLNPDFLNIVIQLLEHYGIKGDMLVFEITESAYLDDIEASAKILKNLTSLGITISIDDFGTGYSSLQYLERMPISEVKIDKSFIKSLPVEPSSCKIVEAAIALAHNLGIRTVAEGIENQMALEFLRSTGCDLIQGYLVSLPIRGDELAKIYKTNNGRLLPL